MQGNVGTLVRAACESWRWFATMCSVEKLCWQCVDAVGYAKGAEALGCIGVQDKHKLRQLVVLGTSKTRRQQMAWSKYHLSKFSSTSRMKKSFGGDKWKRKTEIAKLLI